MEQVLYQCWRWHSLAFSEQERYGRAQVSMAQVLLCHYTYLLCPERCCAECALVTETRKYHGCSGKGGRLGVRVCEEEDVTGMARECGEYSRAVDAGRMYDDGLCRWTLCYGRYAAYACHI